MALQILHILTYTYIRLEDFQVQYPSCNYITSNSFFFLTQTIGCRPVASLDHFVPEHLGSAALVEEIPLGTSKVVKVTTVHVRTLVRQAAF